MKKLMAVCVLLALLAGLCVCACAEALPTLDQVLASLETREGSVEIGDDLSYLDPDAMVEDIDYGNFRLIILQREAPEKEFTALDSGYPGNYVSDFPEDFNGYDAGTARVWVRCDLMRRLPADIRAGSLAEADVIIMAENEYFHTGTISVTDFADSEEDTAPQFDTLEELDAYLESHQPTIRAITLYPKFSCFSLLNLYDPATGQCVVFDYQLKPARRFAQNPEAADQLSVLEICAELCAAFDERDAAGAEWILSALEGDVPEEKLSLWTTLAASGEYDTAAFSVSSWFWSAAQQLRDLDPSEDNRANYDTIIAGKDMSMLLRFGDFCNYSGFDMSVDLIGLSKEYMASADAEWMEASLDELVTALSE